VAFEQWPNAFLDSPGFQASREDRMRAVWEENELTEIEHPCHPFRITYASFDDFWESNSVPVGRLASRLPNCQLTKKMN
jgi:hypothetical protein